MAVGENSVAWADLAEGTQEDEDQLQHSRASEPVSRSVSLETQSDWVLLLVFTAVMTIPFALVAWLMS
jgi:hypothetical protein